jgi:serine/threonine-protein kinase HipA
MLGEMDYLLESPDDRAGALGFGLNKVAPARLRKFNRTLDFAKLQELVEAGASTITEYRLTYTEP